MSSYVEVLLAGSGHLRKIELLNKHPASKAGGNTSGSTAGRKAKIGLLLETIW